MFICLRNRELAVYRLEAHGIRHPRLVGLEPRGGQVADKKVALMLLVRECREARLDSRREDEFAIPAAGGDGPREGGGDAHSDGTIVGGGEEAEALLAFVVLPRRGLSIVRDTPMAHSPR